MSLPTLNLAFVFFLFFQNFFTHFEDALFIDRNIAKLFYHLSEGSLNTLVARRSLRAFRLKLPGFIGIHIERRILLISHFLRLCN